MLIINTLACRNDLSLRTRDSWVKSPRSVVACATSGVIPPDVIPADYEGMGVEPGVTTVASHIADFEGNLQQLPSSTDKNYGKILESNSKIIWDWAKKQAQINLIGKKIKGFTGDVNLIFDHTKYCQPSKISYAEAMVNCRKSFARGQWQYFWDAIGSKVQIHRELQQRVPSGLDLTAAEFKETIDNLNYISRGFGYSAKTTQSKTYITGITRAQKELDAKEFTNWYREKASTITKIVRLNLSDVPFGYAVNEITAFDKDPADPAARKALTGRLLQLQRDALAAYRAAKTAGTAFDFEDWLTGK